MHHCRVPCCPSDMINASTPRIHWLGYLMDLVWSAYRDVGSVVCTCILMPVSHHGCQVPPHEGVEKKTCSGSPPAWSKQWCLHPCSCLNPHGHL
uniref:Uncharacterized protein n=1 Tax=Triticum urartu TaxID=4572 RepID=A0A8R7VDT5_TRIUA